MNKVKGYRCGLNLTQADIAKVLGISETAYRLKETGERAFKLKEVIVLRDFFKEKNIDAKIEDFM
jgi:DNA-binding XRE family transcriptional regulator